MVDFGHLLRKPAFEAKKPPALPIGDYPSVVKKFELTEKDFGQGAGKQPFVRFHVGFTGWPEGVDSAESEGIDLSKIRLSKDFGLADDELWRLDQFLKSLGIDGVGRSYEELLPEAVGCPTTATMQQYMNKKTNEIANQIGALVGAS